VQLRRRLKAALKPCRVFIWRYHFFVLRAWAVGIAILGAVMPSLQTPIRLVPHWPVHAVITVWVDEHGAPTGAEALVARALATWTRAADGRFVLQPTTTRASALVTVRFAAADGIYGETAPRIDRTTGTIGSAEVMIARYAPGDAVRQRIVIYLTALHELGHALGLPHTSAFDDIMYSFSRPDDGERYFGAYQRRLRSSDDIGTARATGLSPADVAALQTLYDR
jgi:hypothetical protein